MESVRFCGSLFVHHVPGPIPKEYSWGEVTTKVTEIEGKVLGVQATVPTTKPQHDLIFFLRLFVRLVLCTPQPRFRSHDDLPRPSVSRTVHNCSWNRPPLLWLYNTDQLEWRNGNWQWLLLSDKPAPYLQGNNAYKKKGERGKIPRDLGN